MAKSELDELESNILLIIEGLIDTQGAIFDCVLSNMILLVVGFGLTRLSPCI